MTAISVIDLHWMGRPHTIGAWRVGDALVDPGPATCLPALLDGLGDWRPSAVLLTHIHFDHAGATGALVARWPDLRVYVHRRGARHLTAPERLEASARRVFGPAFDERFGSLVPIPEANITALDGGEEVCGLEVLYTPGHASHHVSYRDADGCAFVGDVAATRVLDGGPLLLPTPAPDIDLDLWAQSVDAVAAWEPTRLVITHFGSVEEPAAHLAAVRDELALHRELFARAPDSAAYEEAVRASLIDRGVGDRLADYELVAPLDNNYVGLERWQTVRDGG
jgi:glyoxylase-like metal-dependent hydrolase (beta-lactamase superfamily II)